MPFQQLKTVLAAQIVVLDGAMGTMIQQYQLDEADYRGAQFKDWATAVKGNHDLLCITQPHLITNIHLQYLEAGAQVITTNTFNAQSISMAAYGMEDWVHELNVAAVQCAKNAIAEYEHVYTDHTKTFFVAGVIGPTNHMLSISLDVDDPRYRAISFDDVVAAYTEQIHALVEGGVDMLLLETVFDPLNAQAALTACLSYFEQWQIELPIMISATLTDVCGQLLTGAALDAFYQLAMTVSPISIGFNCAWGTLHMSPHIEELSQLAATFVSAYPNAGLPNAMGAYDETPQMVGAVMKEWAENGWINIVGGCCGTTPEHIKSIAEAVQGIKPRIF